MRRLASFFVVAALPVMAVLACGSRDLALHPALGISAKPLPPTAGAPVDFSLTATDIGWVEIFQGDERVSVVLNPLEVAPAGYYRFTARSDAPPRAVGHCIDGTNIEATATIASGPPPKPDAGSDASTDAKPPVKHLTENCPMASPHTSDLDASDVCGGPGGLLVTVRAENLAAYPVDIYRTQQPPTQCTFEGRLRIFPGTIESTTLFDRNIVRIYRGDTATLIREYEMTTGGSCDWVFNP